MNAALSTIETGAQALATVTPTSSPTVALGTLTAASPAALVAGASEMAGTLAGVIRAQHLATVIQGRQYVQVEGWTTLATMLGVTAREVQTTEAEGIYTAVVELVRMSDGAIISRASAECGEEKPWNSRPRYARRSMAQTRATGKACRLAFSWIMRLAGYEPTPAEEMPVDLDHGSPTAPAPQQAPSRSAPPAQNNGAPITEAQHRRLEARIGELGLDRVRVKAWVSRAWGIEHLTQIHMADYDDLDRRLTTWAGIVRAETAARGAAPERADHWLDDYSAANAERAFQ